MSKNKMLIIPAGAVAVAMAIGSVAYGCAVISGQTKITSLGGTSGLTCNQSTDPAQSGCGIDVGSSREVVAEVSGTRPNTDFYLYFLNRASDQYADLCTASFLASHYELKMADGSGNIQPVTSDASGNIASTTRYIPADVHPGILIDHAPHNGTATICWATADPYQYSVHDTTILITGGSAL